MSSIEEPSYLAFARANVRDGQNTSPTIVKALLARIDALESAEKMAEAALEDLADGGRARVIETREELDALPDESVVRSDFGVIHEKRVEFDTNRVVWVCPGDTDEHTAGKITLPATVLHEPTP